MRAVLDACVLFPTVLREILTGVAAEGGYAPLWSPRILEEWRRAALRLPDPAAGAIAEGEIALLNTAFPGASIAIDQATEATLDLPDANDRHVLAAAIDGQASLIVTHNLRDFPLRRLAASGVRPVSPDQFLLADMDLSLVEAVVAQVQARTEKISGREQPLRPLLRRAGLPRLGKALG
ncbi:RSP_2648 family PIN domain-containing protein [Oceanomicrobium pacificus]|uniref:PIN domain-containing protein n=1 Tax=Oceanomicrobium pacificus TaxID=2692916 RepID=A0A6B0TLR4_9RHOB|nr:PIN domain-containing protein [Oceanomicrobium pacificus]MXU65477.1 PIN domain-containing protein [Oceanomicrobium pacificus]